MKQRKNMTHVKQSWDDKLFDFICNFILILFVVIVIYPIYFILIASFTEPTIVNSGAVLVYPKEISLLGYESVFKDSDVWSGYGNTILYTVCGTLLGTAATVTVGYALSRKDMLGRGFIMKMFVFTMYFSGGIIPLFLVIRTLKLVDTRALMIVLGSVSAYNIIVVRAFMMNNIPDELFDAAIIDGCGHGKFFLKIVLPLSKAVISVIVLYIAVSYWNSYFNAMVFMTDPGKYPLQLYLREKLLQTTSMVSGTNENVDEEYLLRMMKAAQVIKYSIIVVATVPILCVYPFIQKYFVKGVMIGSIKG